MATSSTAPLREAERGRSVSVVRLLVAGGATAAALFLLCWVGTFIPFSSPTHAYISLFTTADVSSAEALIEGATWSLLFGALSGALFATVYNAASAFDRR